MTSSPPPDQPPEPTANNAPAQEPPSAPPPAAPPPAQWAPPPPQYAAPQPGYPATGPMARPGLVTAAGITMIVLGSLGAVFGLLLLLGGVFISGAGSAFENQAPGLTGLSGAVGGVLIVLALIVIAIGILDIIAGGYALAARAWARITGIVLSAILAVFWALSLLGGGDRGGGAVLSLILLAANVFVIWALATSGSWFAARRA